jgi:hypothetical protein
MNQLIWIVFIGGLLVTIYLGGTTGGLIYLVAIALFIALFRRPLVLALTRLSCKLGLNRGIMARMPSAIHLFRVAGATEAARPILTALTACKFVDAGVWNIKELPQIQVALMVHPKEGMLAVVESASPIGAQVNVHTLYTDGKLFYVTNSELPAPPAARPNMTRVQFPRCAPNELVRQALVRRPGYGFRLISAEEAPRIYEQLYAEDISFRKKTATETGRG